MAAAIDTTKVAGRRQLHFNSVEDILADVDQLAKSKEIGPLGNWSAGQIFKHLALVMNSSIDGAPPMMPVIARFMMRLFFKRKIITKPMPPGYRLPAKAAGFIPPPISQEEGLQSIRQAIHRLQTDPKRAPSAFLGSLTNEEWTQLHCRHAELHLSFLAPLS